MLALLTDLRNVEALSYCCLYAVKVRSGFGLKVAQLRLSLGLLYPFSTILATRYIQVGAVESMEILTSLGFWRCSMKLRYAILSRSSGRFVGLPLSSYLRRECMGSERRAGDVT